MRIACYQPIWDEHPNLDPGSATNTDPLRFRDQPHPPETGPSGLLPYLDEADGVRQRVVSRLLEDISTSRHKAFIEASAQQLDEAITQARQVFENNNIQTS